MKIKTWGDERTTKEADVEFPLYSRWIGDHSDTFNRVDADGLCISIGKDSGAWYDKLEGPAYEIKITKIDLTHALDRSYVKGNCTEAEFLAVFDEMLEAAKKTRSMLPYNRTETNPDEDRDNQMGRQDDHKARRL